MVSGVIAVSITCNSTFKYRLEQADFSWSNRTRPPLSIGIVRLHKVTSASSIYSSFSLFRFNASIKGRYLRLCLKPLFAILIPNPKINATNRIPPKSPFKRGNPLKVTLLKGDLRRSPTVAIKDKFGIRFSKLSAILFEFKYLKILARAIWRRASMTWQWSKVATGASL